jgi:hypothetical protein
MRSESGLLFDVSGECRWSVGTKRRVELPSFKVPCLSCNLFTNIIGRRRLASDTSRPPYLAFQS